WAAQDGTTASSGGPAATGSATPSTCTCGTPTGTASSSTRPTTGPGTPTGSRGGGASTTTADAATGDRRSRRGGTASRPTCRTWTAGRSRPATPRSGNRRG